MATRRTSTHTYSIPRMLRMLSFVSVMLLGLAITISAILGWIGTAAKIAGYIREIALLIGIIVLCWYSYYDAVTRTRGWFIAWVIAVVLIVVFYILGMSFVPIRIK